jgi:hypothetical protein
MNVISERIWALMKSTKKYLRSYKNLTRKITSAPPASMKM